jgi:tetratricopeptide (TPR) repeat protein
MRLTTLEEGRLVADICVRLDGLPLAIELAAARVRRLGFTQLHARLTQPTFLGVLTDGAQDLADHQRTMRSTIAWSYDLLGAEEQRLFRWLGVFVGGASAEAIEFVSGLTDDALITSLAALMDASLLHSEDHAGARRYAQLVTLRAFAQERLRDAGEWEEARRRHAAYCQSLTDPLAQKTPNQSEDALARIEADYENVRAALTWALETDAIAQGLRMVSALWRFWITHSQYLEGLDWLERFLARATEPTSHEEQVEQAEAWTGLMALSHRLDRFERARDAGERALALRRALGAKTQIAWALNNLANPVIALRDYDRAVALMDECLTLQRESDSRPDMVIPLLNLGELRYASGKPREALACYEESLALSREIGESDWARALTWNCIADAHILLDEPARAVEVAEPSYQLFMEKGDSFGAATCAFTLGRAQWRLGAVEAARAHLEAAERLFGAIGNPGIVARVRSVRASMALAQGDLAGAHYILAQALVDLPGQARERAHLWRLIEPAATLIGLRGDPTLAARLHAAATARRDAAQGPIEPAERDMRLRDQERLRAALGASTWEECLNAGQALSLDDAISLARGALTRLGG